MSDQIHMLNVPLFLEHQDNVDNVIGLKNTAIIIISYCEVVIHIEKSLLLTQQYYLF